MSDDTRWTHASFFSGVGGTDLGLERAGWRTVSFSEIDPYASAVLAHRWPGVPNLGSIVDVRDRECGPLRSAGGDWQDAFLWTGGFPCQDLSVAGKRRGLRDADGAATRSGLAFAFLDLVGRHRPPAFILENVPGLLSSHGGKDLGVLLGTMGELGYWWAYRVLDGRHFGVPQRRRRVFIVALHARICAGADGPAEVLSVGHRCERHPPAGGGAGTRAARVAVVGSDDTRPSLALTRTMHKRHDEDTDTLVLGGAPPDPGGVRAPDGLAGRAHHRAGLEVEVVQSLDTKGGGPDDNEAQAGHLIAVTSGPKMFDASGHHRESVSTTVTPTVSGYEQPMAFGALAEGPEADLLPVGLDSNRYRCCGNGVIAPVAEWLGLRLRAWVDANVPQ